MLKRIDEDLWCAEYDLMLPIKFHFACRMTVIRIPGGKVMVISPIPMDDELSGAIDALGEVAWIVAPNNFHHLFLRAAAERWPNAAIWGPPGLAEKRERLTFSGTLGDAMPATWPDAVATRMVKGAPRMNEFAFFHKPTGTLIVTDLMFHIHHFKTKRTGLLLHMIGAYKKLAQSRFWRMFTKDRDLAGQSVAALFRWDFRRIIVGHGEIVEENARERAKTALKWMLKHQELPHVSP